MTAVLSADTCRTTAIAKVSGADLQVPLVQGGECSYANFDYAASALKIGPGHRPYRRVAADIRQRPPRSPATRLGSPRSPTRTLVNPLLVS